MSGKSQIPALPLYPSLPGEGENNHKIPIKKGRTFNVFLGVQDGSGADVLFKVQRETCQRQASKRSIFRGKKGIGAIARKGPPGRGCKKRRSPTDR